MAFADNQTERKAFLKQLSNCPGVYRMLDDKGQILYVGKARNLKARVSSYFSGKPTSAKVLALINQIKEIEFTITQTEAEALLLESNLIKEHKPRYNISLRDDKSYPYIYLSSEESFPRLAFHRGARNLKGKFFGPYPSAYAVRDTLKLLQKLFRVRQCENSFFKNRSRPCLQYQIKRCTAPCVGYVSEEGYSDDVTHARMFLEGKSTKVIDELVKRMDSASQSLKYEEAAHYRDKIADLHKVHERQFISGENKNSDVIGCAIEHGVCCVQVFFIRDSRNLGNKAFYLNVPKGAKKHEALFAFVGQYYANKELPAIIFVSEQLNDRKLLEEALSQNIKHTVSIIDKPQGDKKQWLAMADINAEKALQMYLATKKNNLYKLELLQTLFQLDETPGRIECFDISHTSGEATVASCVVFDHNGPVKSDYRRFNIKGITQGDDYAAMRQALTRRYTRLKKNEGKFPDILLIDGGKGQISEALSALEELQVEISAVIGVAKGSERIPGQETLIAPHLKKTFQLSPQSAELHLIQQIRDEAHRFALLGHRAQRAKARIQSPLEEIPGLGPKRRQQLLKYYGGMQGLSNASVEQLSKVPNISASLAQLIYDMLHSD